MKLGEPIPPWIEVKGVEDSVRARVLQLDLDKGEASAIALALEEKSPLLLIDEKRAERLPMNWTCRL